MIDFLKFRAVSACVSFGMFLGFAGMCLYRYQTRDEIFSYSIDFTGGTQVLLRFSEPIHASKVKEIVEQSGWEGAETRDFSEYEVLVRVKEHVNDAKGLSERMREALKKELPTYNITIDQSDTVGPGVGETLRTKSIKAVIIALLAMLAFVAFRFWSWSYAVGSVAALFHDAVAILLLFLFFDIEISGNVIGAILAVLGYSINDTIVIFSRIRDNLKTMGGTPIRDIVNISLNQTLRRTILTSLSTGLPVGVMYAFGGEALRDMTFALLIGIIFGTYSSIYIASSIMMGLYQRARD